MTIIVLLAKAWLRPPNLRFLWISSLPPRARALSNIVDIAESERAKMMIKEVKDKSKIDELVLTIVEKKEPREFQSKWSGASGRVCDATGQDDNGDSIGVSLWNDDIEKVELNAKIRITNGWASSYKNKMQVSAGKFGKLEVI